MTISVEHTTKLKVQKEIDNYSQKIESLILDNLFEEDEIKESQEKVNNIDEEIKRLENNKRLVLEMDIKRKEAKIELKKKREILKKKYDIPQVCKKCNADMNFHSIRNDINGIQLVKQCPKCNSIIIIPLDRYK